MSNINPNNIDGSYPVAGQDNNSQGFRDNFTNIKVNFQAAEEEISDLQNKSLLRAQLDGSNVALSVSNDLGGTTPLIGALIRNFGTNRVPLGSASGVVTINYANGHYQTLNTVGSVSLNFTNWPASGTYGYVKIQFNITNIAHTVSLPLSVTLGTEGIQGLSGNTITFGSTGVYEFAFGTYDSGTSVTIFDLNRALTNFTAADLQVDDVTASGNILAGFGGVGFISASGNVLAGQQFIATGNVSGGNILTAGSMSAAGNIQGGNIFTAGTISATGNVLAENINAFVRPSTGTGTQAPVRLTAGSLTSAADAGAVEYDGVVFYSTPTNSSRGLLNSDYLICSASNTIINNSSAVQRVFYNPAAGSITLEASTAYFIEGMYYITRSLGTNAHTLSTLFAVGGSITSITYMAETTSTAGNILGLVSRIYSTGITPVVVTASNSSANENITVKIQGIVRTNAGGTFTPQIQYSAAPGGAPTILANSYFRVTPIGNSTITNIGNWS